MLNRIKSLIHRICSWVSWLPWLQFFKPIPPPRVIQYEETYPLEGEASETDENYKKDQVVEKTPAGVVRMKYDPEEKHFLYWADTTIPTRYLDTVARKYVLVFQKKEWYEKTEVEYTRRKQLELKGPFVNKKEKHVVEITKKMNRFKKKGGLVQIELPILHGKNISFTEYKNDYVGINACVDESVQRPA